MRNQNDLLWLTKHGLHPDADLLAFTTKEDGSSYGSTKELLAVWQAISAAWSPLPSLARDDALLTLFYAAAFAVALLTVRGQVEGLIVAAGVAALGGGLAVATALAVNRPASRPRS